jgi:hypothetical protein
MNKVLKQSERRAWLIMAPALALSIGAFALPPAAAEAAGNSWGNPCDSRDTCSADPAKYADHRENGPVKAREYVGEMRWGTGGAPDDVYVVTRTVGSRNFAGARICDVRDACITGHEAPKLVRGGPSGTEIPMAKQIDSVHVSNPPVNK